MTQNHTLIPSLADTIDTVPENSIVSRTVFKEANFRAIVFAFAPGQELSQHTASVPAVIQILQGECALTIGEAAYEGKPGTWVHMEAGVPHSLLAHTPVKMLLLMMV